jgi:glycerol-3-phosphate acyltransferase PlsX
MRIAVDAMGGDLAPQAILEGAWRAATERGHRLLLVGDRPDLERRLARLGDHGGRIETVHAEEAVEMDDPFDAAIRRKPRSSLTLCAELVRDCEARAMVTAGNTGAAWYAAKRLIGTIHGVDRPALAAVVPSHSGRTVILDVGANPDAKPEHLRQFAVMGHFYAQEVLKTTTPRVGLISIGEEVGKGTSWTREVSRVLEGTGLHFIGNVEGDDLFSGRADVILCDGFVGNVVLKSAESLAELLASTMREELNRNWRSRFGFVVARPAFAAFRRRTDYTEYGAAPLLGLEGGCFIAHGRSNAKAIVSSIQRAIDFCTADLNRKIRDKVAELHAQEELLLGVAAEVTPT